MACCRLLLVLATVRPAGELDGRECQPITSTGAAGGAAGIGTDMTEIGGVFPIPRTEDGEEDDWSSYWELSGSGAASGALPSVAAKSVE